PVRSSSVAEVSTGVRCTRPAIRAAADRTAAGFTSAPFEQPPGWRDGAQHSPGVDGPSRPWYQTSDVCVGRIVRRPLAAPRTETAIARIRDLITSGELAPGSRLPPEQELAAQLGLSRNTAREAVRALVTVRVLDVRRGDGTYVTSLTPDLLLEGVGAAVELMRDDGVLEVLEVRRYLEPAATALAAGRIDAAGLAALRATIGRMRAAGDDEEFVAQDASFHAGVAEAAGNGTLASLLAGLSSRTHK